MPAFVFVHLWAPRYFSGWVAGFSTGSTAPAGVSSINSASSISARVATGGLADTVIAANPAALDRQVATGIVLHQADTESLRAGFDQLLDLHAQPETFRRIRRNGMAADFGWARSAQAYAELYQDLAPELAS